MKVKLDDIIEGMEFGSDDTVYFYDTKKKEVVLFDTHELQMQEDEEDLIDFDSLISLPTKFEIDEYSMMEDFIDTIENPRKEARLYRAISGRGAFRRFKDTVEEVGVEEQWYFYRDQVYAKKAREWCKENDIQYSEESLLDSNQEVIEKGLTITFAKEKDIPIILELVRELAIYEKLEHEMVATPDLYKEWLFEKKVAEILIAREGQEAVGFMLFFHNFSTWLGKAGIYLEDFYVQPEYRNKGYGKALFKKLTQVALERKCGRLEWACLDWNTPSIAFYKAIGATPLDEWTTYRLTTKEIEAIANQ